MLTPLFRRFPVCVGRGLNSVQSLQAAGHLLRLTTILSARCFSSGQGFHETLLNVMASSGSADINPRGNHTATVLFLHGLGDTGDGWCDGFRGISQDHIRYSCPHAPIQSVSLNMGMQMPSWFDIKSLSFTGEEDEGGIKQASQNLQALIAEEEKKVPSSRIVIGGFSQGGAVAVHAALTSEKKLGGLILLSTWLPLHTKLVNEVKGDNSFPVFQGHGTADPMVNYKLGEMTNQKLKNITPNMTFKSYQGMGHSSCPEEMRDVAKWLKDALPQTS